MGFGKSKSRFCRRDEPTRCALKRMGRHAAGEDPVKRRQIVEGAREVFMNVGFDAASMNDITRAAGVSKGTIYVYFENKGELFQTIILEAKQLIFEDLRATLNAEGPAEDILKRFSARLATGMTCEETVKAMRIAIGVAERFPELVRSFFGGHPENLVDTVSNFVAARIETGELQAENPRLAAVQLLELSTGHLWKQRLFGLMDAPPSEAEISEMAENAVTLFLSRYSART
ncbi:TetR/AcrR family transcriptional regulator [Martelella lutilitoris]|uniref:TetR/AcrR family transcriptional regulator n=2 Tax=Martelella lutilitoris TaxID=2583532 RepID=A0A5C4JV37_9HYPH|nr:TetR/AcrR family transcriptional regulator [Martelella lutilitoris]